MNGQRSDGPGTQGNIDGTVKCTTPGFRQHCPDGGDIEGSGPVWPTGLVRHYWHITGTIGRSSPKRPSRLAAGPGSGAVALNWPPQPWASWAGSHDG
ncbi:hypothetical protein MHUMG1_06800 [Metarhizium humberi]|uniref:Uncharacterized protein n=1 Tax=Metarhizium humberi TaxID=2596975 RepID=A0A9P8S6T2_9HYPO|nr:hypothetical protein MHUMG1_06800 [Metarhizium humberi]